MYRDPHWRAQRSLPSSKFTIQVPGLTQTQQLTIRCVLYTIENSEKTGFEIPHLSWLQISASMRHQQDFLLFRLQRVFDRETDLNSGYLKKNSRTEISHTILMLQWEHPYKCCRGNYHLGSRGDAISNSADFLVIYGRCLWWYYQ